jgi:rsbT co-antagonist protein RsbR
MVMGFIGEAYLATKEQIIGQQQEAIREISTPVLQVRDQLLIIPIVGLVDTHRARLLTEGLLKAIRERRAKGVVMDITGVPIVDSKVANHLAQACEAARLMGALVVMTGISSEIALTLVTIGAQLQGVRTVGDLQGGIELIERFLATGSTSGAVEASHDNQARGEG